MTDKLGISIIGCGNHVLTQILPSLYARSDVQLRGIASATGKNATMIARKHNVAFITTDVTEVFNDPDTDCVLICSSQNEHYNHLSKAIEYGKSVLVEKPMVTRLDDFRRIYKLVSERSVVFSLGLNRRYSTYVEKARQLIGGQADAVTYVVAVPLVPPDHWTLDEIEGGGRLVSEGEHFIDICNSFVGRTPISVHALALGGIPDDIRKLCNFAVTLRYENAVATIVFNESGATGYPRETVTILGAGKIAVLEDFSRLTFYGKKRQMFGSRWRADMGHKRAIDEFIAAVRGMPNSLLRWEEASVVTSCMFAAQESIRLGEPINLQAFQRTLEHG